MITDLTTRIKPGAEIVSGIGTVESRGHTPGHMSILIASNGEQALVIGDAITNQLISFAHPRLEAELWVFDRVIDDSAIV